MSSQNLSFVDVAARVAADDPSSPIRIALYQFMHEMCVAAPGIIQSFDPVKQTVVVQLAIREKLLQNLKVVDVAVQPLVDIPIVLYGGGGFTVCPPIAAGDECLVIFADTCIDAWWQNGGIQNQPVGEKRRHDLSDGFAICGLRSQPRRVSNYSTANLQIRSDDGNTVVEVGAGEVTIKAPSVKLGDAGATKHLAFIEDVVSIFNAHTHNDPQGGVTAPPNSTFSSSNGTSKTVAD